MLFTTQVTVRINPRLKYTYLELQPDGSVLVKTPYPISDEALERFICAKSSWINKAKRELNTRFNNTFDDIASARLYFWGEAKRVVYRSTPNVSLHIRSDHVCFNAPSPSPQVLRETLDEAYKNEAQRRLPPFIETFAARINVSPTAVRFRKTKRQWGSCSAANRISLNTMLAKVPLELAEYVIVHELAHIKHKHHQAAFWELVASVMPDYRERRAELKRYTTY